MMTLGIHERSHYLRLGPQRRFSCARVAYNLLAVGDSPTPADVKAFEDICFTLRTSNGTFRTTFRNRFHDVDVLVNRQIAANFEHGTQLRVQDRAVSSGLTSVEWARSLFALFPQADFEASDLLLELYEYSTGSGETFIAEPGDKPLQYIRPPFVVAIDRPESWRNPLLRLVSWIGRRRFQSVKAKGPTRRISCIHPEAQALSRQNPHFHFVMRSVFERTGACHVIRTMNILNISYFKTELLIKAISSIFHSLHEGGLWIVGRTMEDDFSNHVTVFRRGAAGWQLIDRIGDGSELEEMALGVRLAA